MSGDSPATRPRRDWLDIMAVFVLSITAVLTAWCGFEASKWGGEMSIAFSQASSARVQATSAEGEARDERHDEGCAAHFDGLLACLVSCSKQ